MSLTEDFEIEARRNSGRCASTSSTATTGARVVALLSRTRERFRKLSRSLSFSSTDNKKRVRRTSLLPSSVAEYEFIEECGKGASSTVLRAKCRCSRKDVAIKRVDLESLNCDLEVLVREAQVMRQMRHPNLLPLLGSTVDSAYLWLIMPFVRGGTVENVLQHAFPQGLPEPAIVTIAAAVLRALRYLHEHGIVHRDIKSSNILLDKDGSVVLGDLGAAVQVRKPDEQRPEVLLHLQRTTFTGTPQYMSPELVEGVGYCESTDVWSLGVTLVEMTTGRRPHAGRDMYSALYAVLNDETPSLPPTCSQLLRDFVSCCLVRDPSKRWTAAQLLAHPACKKLEHDKAYLVAEIMPRLPHPDVRTRVYASTGGARFREQSSDEAHDTIYLPRGPVQRTRTSNSDMLQSARHSTAGFSCEQDSGSVVLASDWEGAASPIEREDSVWDFRTICQTGSIDREDAVHAVRFSR